jgi:hypothetical protein
VSDQPDPQPTSRAVTRRDLELVIRRALDLAGEQTDGGDAMSEDEVVRIAGEVGLPASSVRQALFELPALRQEEQPTLAARTFGPAEVSAARTISADADRLLRVLEDYLTTREYLRLQRHQPGQAWFVPAEDPLSAFFRAFRGKKRFQLARATRVGVAVNTLEAGRAHVRLDVALDEQRHDAFVEGGVGGTALGMALGGGLAAAGALAGAAVAGPALAVVGGILLGAAGLATGIAAGIRMARNGFQRRLGQGQAALDELLDRLQSGERLEPPTSPVLRRLRDRFIGSLPP